MILADTSVWIDHLHRPGQALAGLLLQGRIAVHPWVIGELALGSLAHRAEFLGLLDGLTSLPVLSDAEIRLLVERRRLHGRGLSLVDAHLLGSVLIAPGALLWTRDKRLAQAAAEAGVAWRPV